MATDDFRQAARALWRTPGFTVTAVVVLALAIAAVTAVFSVARAVVLSPLPLAEPEMLVRIWSGHLERGLPFFSVSGPDFLDWQSRTAAFERLAAYERQRPVTLRGEPEHVSATRVNIDVFPLLGVQPVLGRVLTSDDFEGARQDAVVIGHGLWQRRFGGRWDVLGQTLAFDERSWTIVGVMPASFEIPNAPTDVWSPLPLGPEETARARRALRVLGRLRPGHDLDQAKAELVGIASQLANEHPASNRGWSVTIRPLHETVVSPEFRRSLALVAGGVGFVLLLACANVAGLLLGRATGRQREMAVRTALGARQGALVRLLLIESLLIASVAGVAGTLLALWSIDFLKMLGAGSVPRLDEVRLNLPVLAFTGAVTLLTAGLFGLAPALQTSRSASGALRARAASAGTHASRGRSALIVAEVALAVVLLVGASLMMRSFLRLQHRALGFEPAGVLVAQMAAAPVPGTGGDSAAATTFLLTRVAALPGVTSAAGGSNPPFAGPNSGNVFEIAGAPSPADDPPDTDYRVVTSGYFTALGIPIERGRTFEERDGPDAPAVIISRTAAQRYWPDREPLGAQVRLGSSPWMTVVGIAGDARYFALDEPGDNVRPMMYVPHRQMPGVPLTILVRTSGAPAALAESLRTTLRQEAATRPITRIDTMAALLAEASSPQRFATTLLVVFAWMAAALAAAGLYGLLAYLVGHRTREIGVRVALGASPAAIVRTTAGRGLALAGAGVVLGLAGAWGVGGLMQRLLFEVSPTDPAIYAIVAGGFLAVAGAASYAPTRRALRVDPVDALRAE